MGMGEDNPLSLKLACERARVPVISAHPLLIRPPRSFSTRLDEKAEEARRAIERVGKLDAL
jgi:hypothetical protein